MKIGVYFCSCGVIISEKIDAGYLKESILQIPGVAYFKNFDFLCSENGKEFLENDIREEKPERVVIAACSPRDHERTFMEALSAAGMNPYLMQMVNIREQVAWVTAEKDRATQKALTYLKAAIARVEHHEPLQKTELTVRSDALIIGAGPAGLKAALSIAESDRKAIVVEKSPLIGGLPVRYEDVFPTMECGPCMLEPVLSDILHGEYSGNIELFTLSEVEEVAGYYGNFIVKIKRHPRYVDTHTCIGCTGCLEACPVSGKNEFDYSLSEKKAISFPFMGALPNAPYIDPALCLRFKGEDCRLCKEICKEVCGLEDVINYDDEESIIERNVGAIIVAVGADLYDCGRIPKLGFGEIPDVYTNLGFERILSSNGPTGGEIKRKDEKSPEAVAIIHCVGSLDDNHKSYCSEVCCLSAFKYNQLISDKIPGTKIFHFYKELVFPGKDGYLLYNQARNNKDSVFVRYQDIDTLKVEQREGRIAVIYNYAEGKRAVATTDMVVLCPALVPSYDLTTLGPLLEVEMDNTGFFEELHGRLDASRSTLKGIYLAGTCHSPMDIQKAMNQGMASSGYILSGLVEGRKVGVDPITALVNDERCSGCRVCVLLCPFKAISFDEEKNSAAVNQLLCQGCGTCVAACPAGAIKGNHFSREAILAELSGILKG